MRRVTVITRENGKLTAISFEDGRACGLTVDDPANESLVGAVFTARVLHRVKNLNACFVEISPGENAYLEYGEQDAPKPGSVITVQVTADKKGEKGCRVSRKIVLADALAVLQTGMSHVGVSAKIADEQERARLRDAADPFVKDGYGFVLRTAAAGVPEETLTAQLRTLADRYEDCRRGQYLQPYACLYRPQPAWLTRARDEILRAEAAGTDLPEIVTDLPDVREKCLAALPGRLAGQVRLYERTDVPLGRVYSMEKVMAEAAARRVWLPCGGNIVIDRTEAMTVIDVNSAKSVRGGAGKAEHILKVDREAAAEAARQMRLRSLSGIILIDFIDPASPEDEEALCAFLRKELARDPVRAELVEMTRLHFAVITRRRTAAPGLPEEVPHA